MLAAAVDRGNAPQRNSEIRKRTRRAGMRSGEMHRNYLFSRGNRHAIPSRNGGPGPLDLDQEIQAENPEQSPCRSLKLRAVGEHRSARRLCRLREISGRLAQTGRINAGLGP
jgi:hypothetical protein